MVEYNLANILAFDEILREFETTDSMFVFEYNEFVERANDWYKKLSKKTFGAIVKRASEIKFFRIVENSVGLILFCICYFFLFFGK